MKWKIKPLTMEALMIHDDSSRPHPKLAHVLPLLLLLLFSSQNPFFFLSSFYSWLLFFKWEEMRKNVFYKLFLLASSHALVWFWCVRLERKTRKMFGWKENEESGFMITLLVN